MACSWMEKGRSSSCRKLDQTRWAASIRCSVIGADRQRRKYLLRSGLTAFPMPEIVPSLMWDSGSL